MDWDDLKHVLAVSRQGGLSGAARLLGVNHSTVSRRITSMEERLGAQLFERTPTGHQPTEAGLEAINAAERMEEASIAFERRLAGKDNQPAGLVTLTAPLMILMGPFMEIAARFRDAHPQIELKLIASNDLLDLQRREADVAIRVSDAPDERLFGMRLTEQRSAVYAAPAYLARHAAAIRDHPETAPLEWIGHDTQDAPPPEVQQVFPATRLSVRMNDKLGMMAAAKAGMGMVRLPCFQGDVDPALARAPRLGLYRYPDKWILTHPDLRKSERIRLVMRFAAEAVRRKRALFMGEGPKA